MTLDTHEFMRRFLLHVLPRGFHRKMRACPRKAAKLRTKRWVSSRRPRMAMSSSMRRRSGLMGEEVRCWDIGSASRA
jgi:hypothetical protein